MLRVLCVDDEKLTLQYLVSLCRDIPEISEVYGTDKPVEVLAWLRDNPCDLVFLDISMPETDGIRDGPSGRVSPETGLPGSPAGGSGLCPFSPRAPEYRRYDAHWTD